VEYALVEIPEDRGRTLYRACKARRQQVFSNAKKDDKNNTWNNAYLENLKKLSQKGKRWREGQNKLDAEGPIQVLG